MSQENVATVCEGYRIFVRTHELDLDRLSAEIEWHTRADLPDAATHRGHDGVARLAADWNALFDDVRFDIEESIDAGEYVVVVLTLRGRIKGSGQEVEMGETHVWKMLDGKGLEVREYATRSEALTSVATDE